MTAAEHIALDKELDAIAECLAQIGNIIGPAYGAAWCDKALELHRSVSALQMQLRDQGNDWFDVE